MDTKIELSAHHINQSTMIDLHGSSIEESKIAVNRYLSLAEERNITEFRFVTGRGNHQNSDGERGKLYREFLDWISEENQKKIASIEKGDGYYQVKMKPVLKKTIKDIGRALMDEFHNDTLAERIDEIKKTAEKGDAQFQYLLGRCYQYEIGLNKNEKEAVIWYEKSVKQNTPEAQYALGGCYWMGQGVRQNDQKAISLFEAAAANKHPFAIQQLGDIYYGGTGVKEDISKAVSYYQQSSDLGLEISKRRLASIYLNGEGGIEKNEKKAFILYKEVADNGDPFASYNVAIYYLNGIGTPKNNLLAFKYANQAANKNDPDGQWLVSQFYRGFHSGVKADEKLCLKYLKLAANNQHKHALFELAFHPSITDKLVKIDCLVKSAKAGEIIAQAMVLQSFPDNLLLQAGLSSAEKKNISDQFWNQPDKVFLSILSDAHRFIVFDAYMMSDNLTKNQKSKIMRLLDVLRKQGDPRIFVRLGGIYLGGDIVKSDAKLAEKYWLEGASLGSHECLCNIGYLYEEKKEYEKAFYYHSKASEQGNANSHNQLGLLYQNGWGVEQNIEKAIVHFLEAAKLDDPDKIVKERDGLLHTPVFPYAASNLGVLYLKLQNNFGEDEQEKRTKMRATAVAWLLRADKAGHKEAGKLLEKLGINKKLDELIHEDKSKKDKLNNYQNSNAINFWKSEKQNTENTVEQPIDKLKIFTTNMGFDADWKIAKNDSAWCYIDKDKIQLLGKYDITPMVVRETKEGKYILLIECISKQNLTELYPKPKHIILSEKPRNF